SSPAPTGDLPSIDFLYGFSGLAGGRNRIEGFVPPIYDLLDPEGHFKREEAAIVALNREIKDCNDSDRITALKRERRERSVALQEWIFDQFEVLNARGERLTIAEVFARRGLVPPSGTGECAAPKLLQYAYLHGLKPLAFGEFWYGASPVGELRRPGSFYPSCTGKCGPLLDFMLEGLEVEPDPLARTWDSEQIQDNRSQTADCPDIWEQNSLHCSRNTAIGILYEDEAILVVDKPSGILSVPGRTNPVSIPALLEKEHGVLYPCHRLDMDTSGLMVYAKTLKDQAELQRQFAGREVRKTYRARLIGPLSSPAPTVSSSPAPTGDLQTTGHSDPDTPRDLSPGAHGWIDLPIGPDWYDRPRQKVDREEGKHALTEYEILAVLPDGGIEVRFTPHTGRTHQLRVHAAHPEGLGRPILGDRLYGGHGPETGSLHLRADALSFRHPRSGAPITFNL
ncbi:MAG: RluA family pseudouridine synthase, partial [Bacteroidales bacterium]|nr:RluA family pseudouridine synthase [Bacteroidales bacterium]